MSRFDELKAIPAESRPELSWRDVYHVDENVPDAIREKIAAGFDAVQNAPTFKKTLQQLLEGRQEPVPVVLTSPSGDTQGAQAWATADGTMHVNPDTFDNKKLREQGIIPIANSLEFGGLLVHESDHIIRAAKIKSHQMITQYGELIRSLDSLEHAATDRQNAVFEELGHSKVYYHSFDEHSIKPISDKLLKVIAKDLPLAEGMENVTSLLTGSGRMDVPDNHILAKRIKSFLGKDADIKSIETILNSNARDVFASLPRATPSQDPELPGH